MISFCFLSFEHEDIPVIQYGVNIHEDLSLKAFVNNKAVSLRSLNNCNTTKLKSVTTIVEVLK